MQRITCEVFLAILLILPLFWHRTVLLRLPAASGDMAMQGLLEQVGWVDSNSMEQLGAHGGTRLHAYHPPAHAGIAS